MNTLIRLLTGRISYERKAALLAAELASRKPYDRWHDAEYGAQRIYHFLLTGEFPEV